MIENLPENTESKGIFAKGKVDCKLAEGREEVHGGIRYIYIHIHPGMYGLDSPGLFISARARIKSRSCSYFNCAKSVAR